MDSKVLFLYKLEYYGFRGIVLVWFKNYLKIENSLLDIKHVILRIRISNLVSLRDQFYVHCYLFFMSTISHLQLHYLKSFCFADDTTLWYSHPDIATKINLINKELSEICNWFKANKLSINASKNNYMMLGTSYTTN